MSNPKTILITGSTDGIGLAAAKDLTERGNRVVLHGRSPTKLESAKEALGGPSVPGLTADLSRLDAVEAFAAEVAAQVDQLDVLINNAGVYKVAEPRTAGGLDVRFVVNTVAPYLLTQQLLPLLGPSGRVINLSSAAQAPVDLEALAGSVRLSDDAAYAQSKLALTMWSHSLGLALEGNGPAVVALNPGSLLGTKMVKEAYGIAGKGIDIGADILRRAALDDEFAQATGRYFDNDSGRFAAPHTDALDLEKCRALERHLQQILTGLSLGAPANQRSDASADA